MKKSKILPGFFMTGFLTFAFLISVTTLMDYPSGFQNISQKSFLHGNWSQNLERTFDTTVPVHDPATHLWALLNYSLYRDGKPGVLIGDDGWLFTAKEFSNSPDSAKNIRGKMNYIQEVKNLLAQKNTALLVAPLPSKARVYNEHLRRYRFPSYHKNTYSDFIAALHGNGIVTADLFKPLSHDKDTYNVFLRTDTHWSPEGAELAPQEIAKRTKKSFPVLKFPETSFSTQKGKPVHYRGDLLRYIPLGAMQAFGPEPDKVTKRQTQKRQKADAALTQNVLFGEEKIPVTLVGTSYSADPLWNFHGALENFLRTDILSAADPGLGPFETMRNYLEDKSFMNNPPKLVIWEIPERYLHLPLGFKKSRP